MQTRARHEQEVQKYAYYSGIIIIVYLLSAFNPATAYSQFNLSEPSMQRAQEILPQAFKKFTRKEYDSAIVYLRQILELRPRVSTMLDAFIHYHLGVNYCLSGNTEEALSFLDEAVNRGFAESSELANNLDLATLRKSPKFAFIIAKAEKNSATLRRYDITLWENQGLGFASLHHFDSWSDKNLSELRQKYRFDSLMKPSFSELDAQVCLMNWVHHRWKHNPLNIAPRADALSILDSVASGATYRCVEYAIVLCQVLQSMGYPARVVELNSKGVSYGIAKAHVAVECWNNELRKWIFLDAQTNSTWKNGQRFLNADEIRDLILDNRLDSLEMYAYPSAWLPRDQVFPGEWLKYFYYLNYRFDNRYSAHPESVQGLAPMCFLRDNQTPELLYQGMPRPFESTLNYDKIYPNMNLVHADITQVSLGAPGIDLYFNKSIPSFSYYQIIANGIETVQLTDDFHWNIQPGANSITVRGVNQAGVKGPQMSIKLNYTVP